MIATLIIGMPLDITASIQRKTEKIAGRDRSDKLLHDLAGSPPHDEQQGPSSSSSSTAAAGDSSASSSSWIPHADRFSHLPLWRRVDRRFWWNEELMQPFVNAGVGFYLAAPPRGS